MKQRPNDFRKTIIDYVTELLKLSPADMLERFQWLIEDFNDLERAYHRTHGLWATDLPGQVDDPTGIMFRIGFHGEHSKPPFMLNHRSGSHLRRVSFQSVRVTARHNSNFTTAKPVYAEGFFILWHKGMLSPQALVEDDNGEVQLVDATYVIFMDKQGSSAGPALSATNILMATKSADNSFDPNNRATIKNWGRSPAKFEDLPESVQEDLLSKTVDMENHPEYQWTGGERPPNDRRDIIFSVGVPDSCVEYLGCFAPMTRQYLRRDENGLLLKNGFPPAQVRWREIQVQDYIAGPAIEGESLPDKGQEWQGGITPPDSPINIFWRRRDNIENVIEGYYSSALKMYIATSEGDVSEYASRVEWKHKPELTLEPTPDLPF